MSCAVRPGTFFSTTERPPNRFAEPGRICSVVTPPFISARREAGVLRPDAMLGPDFGPHRDGRLVAVGIGADAGRWIIAEVAVDVDDAGRDELAGAVDLERSGRRWRARARRPPGSTPSAKTTVPSSICCPSP